MQWAGGVASRKGAGGAPSPTLSETSLPALPQHRPPRPPRAGIRRGLHLLRPSSLWAFFKYNIVIFSSLWPARGREVLPRWAEVLEAAEVPVSRGLPPPGLAPGLLGAVIQGQGSHSLRLIIYVVGPWGRLILNAVIQRVYRRLRRAGQDAPQALPQGTGHRVEGHRILPLQAPWPGRGHRGSG